MSPQMLLRSRATDDVDSGQVTWDDVDLSNPRERDWLLHQSNAGERAEQLLLQRGSVLRRVKLDRGFFVSLRDAAPADRDGNDQAGSLGLIIEKDRVLTVHEGPMGTIETMRARLAEGEGPGTPLEFLADLVVEHADQLEDLVAEVSAETESMEDQVLAEGDNPPLAALNVLRHKAFRIRSQLVSQRNLLNFISVDRLLRIGKEERGALSSASEHVGCYLEALQDGHERLQLLHDRMESQLAATMNRVSYNLTVVATVFLPLTFLSGLLGMNVAGMPETHNPWGFWIVCVVLGAIAVGSWLFLRWRRWA